MEDGPLVKPATVLGAAACLVVGLTVIALMTTGSNASAAQGPALFTGLPPAAPQQAVVFYHSSGASLGAQRPPSSVAPPKLAQAFLMHSGIALQIIRLYRATK